MSTLYVIEEMKNPNSKWADYFTSWPQTYDEYPRLFDDEDLAWL